MLETVQRRALPIAIVASVLLSLFAPRGVWIDELFVTYLHEASHGLAAILTGGHLLRFVVNPDTSGTAYSVGGFGPLISAAGYVGACLWGGALLVSARRRGLERAVCLALAAFFVGFTLLFTRNLFGVLVGFGFGGFFAWVGLRGHGALLAVLLNFLAVRCILNAFVDLRTLLVYAGMPGAPLTDAQIMSNTYTGGLVPAMVFALGICAMSLAALGGFLWLAWRVERKLA